MAYEVASALVSGSVLLDLVVRQAKAIFGKDNRRTYLSRRALLLGLGHLERLRRAGARVRNTQVRITLRSRNLPLPLRSDPATYRALSVDGPPVSAIVGIDSPLVAKEAAMTKKHTGRCACGAVKFEPDTDPTFVAVCHCLDCKKASGGEAATFFGAPEDDFTLISGEPKAFHYIAQSGKGLDRRFCPTCSARVFTTNLESVPGMIFVTPGSLDNLESVEPMLEMFTKRRLEWAKPLDLPQIENMPS